MKLNVLAVVTLVFLGMTACGKQVDSAKNYETLQDRYVVEKVCSQQCQGESLKAVIIKDKVFYTESDHIIRAVDTEGKSREIFCDNDRTVEGICDGSGCLVLLLSRYEGDKKHSFCLFLDMDGNKKNEMILDVPEKINFQNVAADVEGNLYVAYEDKLYRFGKDGHLLDIIDTGKPVQAICSDESGRIVLGCRNNGILEIGSIETDSAGVTVRNQLKYFGNENNIKFYGSQTQKPYIADDNFLYVIGEEYVAAPVVNWLESGIDERELCAIAMAGAENAIIFATWQEKVLQINKLLPKEKAEQEKECLILACNGIDTQLMEHICEYNEQSSKYYVAVRNYEREEDPYNAFHMDVLSGKKMDIIEISSLAMEKYAEKGLLQELTEFIEPEKFVPSYIKAISVNGKIYEAAPTFYVNTILGNKTEAGENVGWNHKQYRDFLQNAQGVTIAFSDRNELLRQMFQMSAEDFVLEESGRKQIDADKLREELQFIAEFDKKSSTELYEQGYTMFDLARSVPSLLIETALMTANDYRTYSFAYDGKMIAKGYPVDKRCGNYMGFQLAFGIGATSQSKEAAWDFIQYFMEDSVQCSMAEEGFPTKLSALETTLNKAMRKDGISEGDLTITINGTEETVPQLTKDNLEELKEVLWSADRLLPDNKDIMNIVQEEAEGYFCGQQSLETIMKIIVNRANVYLAE